MSAPATRSLAGSRSNAELVKNHAQHISQQLFADRDARVYAVLDGARIPDLLPKLDEQNPESECLYRGELAPDIAEVAPYLVQLEPASPFTNWILQHGWGNNWGIFATSPADLRAMRRHFRTFLIVHDEEGKPLYFRFYDPRVLRVYLPTCNADELKTVLGPVSNYFLEDENPNIMLRFSGFSGSIQQERVSINSKQSATEGGE